MHQKIRTYRYLLLKYPYKSIFSPSPCIRWNNDHRNIGYSGYPCKSYPINLIVIYKEYINFDSVCIIPYSNYVMVGNAFLLVNFSHVKTYVSSYYSPK